jgi:thiamine pyrophosphokinase
MNSKATFKDKLLKLQSFQEVILVGPIPHQNLIPFDQSPHFFIDGGSAYHHQYSLSNCLSFYLGDLDSIDDDLKTSIAWDQQFSAQKDESDLKLCLSYIPNSVKRIHMNGFLGGNLDHQMIVLGDLYHFLQNSPKTNIFLYENQKIIVQLSSDPETIIEHQGIFSLATLHPQNISIKGQCEYSGDYHLEPLSSQGLSNFGQGEFSIQHPHPLIVFYRDGFQGNKREL